MGSVGDTAPTKDIHVIIAAVPFYGHVRGQRKLAANLAARGYPVTFITGNTFRKSIEALKGVEFFPLQGMANFDPDAIETIWPARTGLQGPDVILHDTEHVFLAAMPDQFNTMQTVLRRPDVAARKAVVLADGTYLGGMPMLLGSEKAKRVPQISIGHFPLVVLSKDTAPFGPGLPSQGEEKNLEMNKGTIQMFAPVDNLMRRMLEPYNCPKPLPSDSPFDNWVMIADIWAQLCVPEIEYERSDLPSNVRFFGALNFANDIKKIPDWYEEFVVNDRTKHPLIIATSGTVAGVDVHDVIIPTIEACKDLPVRVVVCSVHASLPKDYPIPANVRVAEWIAFEQIFPYTSLVVSNGGYGGINQAFAAGIPMVVAGTTEDKMETCMRAEMTGAAINLRCQRMEVDQLKDAVQKVLKEPIYKEKAQRMQQIMAKTDAVENLANCIEELAAKFYS